MTRPRDGDRAAYAFIDALLHAMIACSEHADARCGDRRLKKASARTSPLVSPGDYALRLSD